MNWGLVFKLANLSVLPGWVMLIFAPKARVTKWIAHSYAYSLFLGFFYLFMLIVSLGGDGGMNSLENLKTSFQHDEVLILGWIHYLVFDLFVGAWIARDAQSNGIPHLIVVPILLLTLFAGPIGLLCYLVIRAIRCRNFTL